MAVNLGDAEVYIADYVIDNDDWNDANDAKKQRILNVAERTLTTEFSDYTIPDNAVYEFGSVLAVVFNDTNRMQQHGIAGFSVTGVASFTFKENNVRTPGGTPLKSFIPKSVYDLINADQTNIDNELAKLGGRSIKDVTM